MEDEVNLFEGDPKAPLSIATTLMYRGERYSFPGLLHFTLDAHLIMLSVKQGCIKYHFWVFCMTRPRAEPRSPGPLANTLVIRPIALLRMKQSFATEHLYEIFNHLNSVKMEIILIEYDSLSVN